MGYDIERFQDSINEELKCPICCGVLEDPLQGQVCEHAFCRKCINEWMKTSETCPVDRNILQPAQLQPIPRIVRNMLSHLQIKCDFHPEGCCEIIALEDLNLHRSSCPHNPEYPVPCKRDCGALIPKSLLDKHDCIQDLRALIFNQQKEIQELKCAVEDLIKLSEQQKQITANNNSSLSDLSERYEHLKISISNLEKPLEQILFLANHPDFAEKNPSIRDKLVQETTVEIYVSNVDLCACNIDLKEYLNRNEINVISCKKSRSRGLRHDFRITVFKSDCSRVLSPDLWPKGIVCFVCGEYYSTRIEGKREINENDILRASVAL